MRTGWSVIAALLLLATERTEAQQLDCSVLAPGSPIQSEERSELEVKAGGLLKPVIAGEFRREVRRIAKDLRTEYGQAEALYRWDSIVYLLCGLLNSAQLSAEEKFARLQQVLQESAYMTLEEVTGKAQQTGWCEDVRFDLKRCSVSAGRLSCDFTVESDHADRKITIYARSGRLFEGRGRVVSASGISIADDEDDFASSYDLPATMPVDGAIWFSSVPADVDKAALLELKCKVSGGPRGDTLLKFVEIGW